MRLMHLNRNLLESREALRVSSERLEMALVAGSIGTWEWDPQTGAVIWDGRCRAALGMRPQTDFHPSLFLEMVVPEDRL
jgi:PAS domain-containing protein